jgi:hypothetical protein
MLCVDSPNAILKIQSFDKDQYTKDDFLGDLTCEIKEVVLNANKEYFFKLPLNDSTLKQKQNIGTGF